MSRGFAEIRRRGDKNITTMLDKNCTSKILQIFHDFPVFTKVMKMVVVTILLGLTIL